MSAGLALSLPSGDARGDQTVRAAGPSICDRRTSRPANIVRQYGQPIGTSLGIAKGEWVTHDNMTDEVPVVRNLPEDLQTPAPDYFAVGRDRDLYGLSPCRTAVSEREISC